MAHVDPPAVAEAHVRGVGIPQFAARPASVTWYWCQEHELKALMSIERPGSMAVSMMALGATIGLLPMVEQAFKAFADPSKMTQAELVWNVAYCMVCSATFILGIVTGLYTLGGKSDGTKLLREIKNRPTAPV